MMETTWFSFRWSTEADTTQAKIVALTTDFGLKDPYVAEMKAVILSVCPNAVIVDVTHEVERFNIRMGAYVLAAAAPYFPKNTIHVAVVDPGVGGQRRSIIIHTERGFFVGPDNGLMFMAAEKQGIVAIREITNPKRMLPKVSNTFHGRDVFASTAGHLANGVSLTDFGPEIRDVFKPEFANVKQEENGLVGEVIIVDGFGNIITNINQSEMAAFQEESIVNVELSKSKLILGFHKSYAEAKVGEALVLVGSQGFVEIAVNQGSAAANFGAKPGDKVRLSLAKRK